jgi:hypothetical protein
LKAATIPAVAVLCALLCAACSKRQPRVEADKPSFVFSAEFPPDFAWQVVTTFESTTDNALCKSLSPVSGKLVPGDKSEFHKLDKTGDSVGIPLFLETHSPCEWKLDGLSIQEEGPRCKRFHALLFVDAAHDTADEYAVQPDSLTFVCKNDIGNGCLECDEATGGVHTVFRLKPGLHRAFHLQIRIP